MQGKPQNRRLLMSLLLLLCLLLPSCRGLGSGVGSLGEELAEPLLEGGEAALETPLQALVILTNGLTVQRETVTRLLPTPGSFLSVEQHCHAIYLTEAALQEGRGYQGIDLVGQLVDRQMEDGSFGFPEETVLAALTLENVGASYDREAVLRLLIGCQRPDGGFCTEQNAPVDLALTGSALSLLSCFPEDTRATTIRG